METGLSGTRILLVRHAETDWNRDHRFQGRSDLPLNEKGREQARALGLALQDELLAAIYSSPLARALETARLIGGFHPGVPILSEEGLVEMNLGELEGMEWARWAREYPDLRRAWLKNPAGVCMPGGESLPEVQERALGALNRVAGLHPPGSTLLLCSHSFVNLTLLCRGMQIPLARMRELQQGPAALNVLHRDGDRLRAELVNDRTHLEKYGAGQAL